jgi:hypothetical protein
MSQKPQKYDTTEIETSPVRRSRSGDLCKGECHGEAGTQETSDPAGCLSERTARKIGAWATLSIGLVGGILRQLIDDVRSQLAAHQDSITWYEGEIEKAATGRDWHRSRLEEVTQRLAYLEELAASMTAIADDDDDDQK